MLLTSIAVLLRILSNPLGNVFQKELTQRGYHPLTINFLTFSALGILCLVPALHVEWGSLPGAFWAYSAAAGVFGATGNALLVRALQGGELSILGPINAYKSVVGLIAGILLLREIPNTWGVFGIALIVGGSYFVLDTMPEKFSAALLRNKEIRYRLWAMVLTAIEAVLIKKVILLSSPTVSFIMWCWFGALFSLSLLPVFRVRPVQEFTRIKRSDLTRYAYIMACIGTMQYTTNYVFDRMDVGYALALFQLSTLVSILLGNRVFGEQNVGQKMLGAGIMLIGSILIILLK